jgi:hypothetical protein
MWVTAAGEKTKIRDMTDSHLLNTIRFVIRRAHAENQAIIDAGPPCFGGEMAEYYADLDYATALERTPIESAEAYCGVAFNVDFEELTTEADFRALGWEAYANEDAG